MHTAKPWANAANRTSFREGTITSVMPGPKYTVQFNDGKQPGEQSSIEPKFIKLHDPAKSAVPDLPVPGTTAATAVSLPQRTQSCATFFAAPVRPRTPSETLAEHLGVSQSEARARLNNIPRLREEFFKARSLNQRDQARDIKKQIRELEEPLFVVGQVCARASG